MNFHLELHNSIFLLGAVINVAIIIFVLAYSRRYIKITPTIVAFLLMNVAVLILQISQVMGTNAENGEISRKILMFNLTNFFIGIFMTWWFLLMIGKVKQYRIPLYVITASGLGLVIFFIIFPKLFLVESVPKLYFPYFYEPGPLYIVNPLWFFIVGIFYFYTLIRAYTDEQDFSQKNRFKYVFFSILFGFMVGITDFLLVFDIKFDPLLSSLFGFYTLPLTYAIIKFELLDIRILAKRAFSYSILVISLAVVISLINILGDNFSSAFPDIPKSTFYVFPATIIGIIGILTWKNIRESDMIKYQFIHIVSHSFRTPLTQIKWGSEELVKQVQNLPEAVDALKSIQNGHTRLVELTDLLITLDAEVRKGYIYQFTDYPIISIVNHIAEQNREMLNKKRQKLEISNTIGEETVHIDPEKIRMALQILLENAIYYTPEDGQISVSISRDNKKIILNFTDNGIGIRQEELNKIFKPFSRGSKALSLNTQGSGIGLYLSREIVRKCGGEVTVFSKGENMGTTFTVLLPLGKRLLSIKP